MARGRNRKAGAREPSGRLQRTARFSVASILGTSVYVITCSTSRYCKVGKSLSPAKRVAALSTAGVGVFVAEWAVRFPNGDAGRVEYEVHKRLKEEGWHAKREWFGCSVRHAVTTIKEVATELGAEMAPDINLSFDRVGDYSIAEGHP